MRRRQGANKFKTRKFTGGKELTVYSARNGYVDYMEICGDAWQASTTGTQLFDLKNVDATRCVAADLSGFVSDDRYVLSNMVPVKGGERIGKSGTGAKSCAFLDSEKAFISGASLSDGMNVGVPDNVAYFVCNCLVENTGKAIIYRGETEPEWETFSNGKASPSQDYPQDIIGLTNPAVHAKNTVTYPYTLYGMGDVKDRLIVDKAQRRAWVERKFGSTELTGNETFSSGSGSYIEGGTTNAFCTVENMVNTSGNKQIGYCTHLKFQKLTWATSGSIGFCFNANQIHLRLANKTIGVSDDAETQDRVLAFKSYIKKLHDEGNPITCIYEHQTPEIEEIPWEDALLLITQLGDNIVSITNADEHLSPTLEVHTKVLPYCYKNMISTGNPVVVETTVNKPMSIEMTGWTEQDSTTGKNLIDIKEITADTHDTIIECNISETVFLSVQGEIATVSSVIWRFKIDFSDGNSLYMNDEEIQNGGKRFDASDEKKIVKISYRGTYITSGKYDKIQLEVGNAKTEYEQYTGNKPSPSPDYPQEIRNAGKYNEETQKYEWIVKITNKNLFNKEYASKKENWKNGENYPYISIFVGKGNTVSFCYSKELELGLGLYVLISKEPGSTPKSYRWLYHSTAESLINKSGSFMAENDEIYLSVAGANSTLLEKFMENIGNDLQIEISESPTAYVEHAEQSVKITSGRPVSKWDMLECRDGVYGWVYKSKEYTLDGTEKWLADGTSKFFTRSVLRTKGSGNGFCNALTFALLNGDYSTYTWSGAGYFELFNVEGRTTQEEIQQWIKDLKTKGTELTVVYEGEEEEFVPLPEEEQEKLKALFSYSPTMVVSNYTGMFMQVEYQTKEGNGEEV